MKTIFLFFVAFMVLQSLSATNYYVSGTGSDSNDGLSPTSAFANIQTAADLTNPGDVVNIMNGTYNQAIPWVYSNHSTILVVNRSGEENAYITYKNYPGHHPVISGENCRWGCVEILASYIKLEGLEIAGNNQNITYAQARVYYDYYEANKPSVDWTYLGEMNVNGLCIGQGNLTTNTNHVEVRNCIVHDFQGAGIGGGKCDYITVENNISYNNSWYGMYATSGLSFNSAEDIDTNTGYKIIVRGNIVYNNKCLIPWASHNGLLSDGNGIIIDTFDGSAYAGKTLVENNLSYFNGGSGIHSYNSSNVDIRNNTAYNNGQVVGYPEIFANSSTNCNIVNNIMYARDGGYCNDSYDMTNVVYDYNLYYGPTRVFGTNDATGDPLFVNLSTDPAVADFHLQMTSPAINTGSSSYGVGTIDLDGNPRVANGVVDKGCYELPAGTPPTVSITSPANNAS
ncbi:MAG: right-handed parallel beta-helix repeat-containing protein, partial [Salinivirgaceae bacterium]|nr:right-handed parallel beta-helix repeat-containing protein [Salinivirgaceae bacterium]